MIQFNMTWMEEALFLAEKAAIEDEVPVGAVVVHDNQIIGKGHNTREKSQNPVGHAEILAIQGAAQRLGSWRLPQAILVVTLEPCMMCLAACQQARLSHVFYGSQDPKGGAISLGYKFHEDPRTNHRFSVSFMETPKCSHVLKSFFEKKRRRT